MAMATRVVAAGCALGIASAASASIVVTLDGNQSITATGQVFQFDFTNVPAALSAGSLTIEVLGDYSPTPPSSETLTWDVDGVASGVGFEAAAFPGGGGDLFQNAAEQTFSIALGDMQAITADGLVTVTLTNSSAVNFFSDQPEDFVRFSLVFDAIPTPGAAGVLAIAGLAAVRRRR